MDPGELYGLPLDRFVPERTALARSLRAEGRRDEAAAVGALRKPSVAAWAVNQLVRTQPKALAVLFAAGDALREAQSAVLAGHEHGRALREAAEGERAAVEKLIDAGRGMLGSQGNELSPAVLERVAESLHAAAIDDEARTAIRDGCLEHELRHVGLGPARPASQGATRRQPRGGARATNVSRRQGGAGATQRPDEARGGASATRRPDDVKTAARERADARRAARIAGADARREADRAQRALQIAQERRDRAAQALADAEQALAQAVSDAQAAADAHRRAQAELDAL
jgi:hypothetical protein